MNRDELETVGRALERGRKLDMETDTMVPDRDFQTAIEIVTREINAPCTAGTATPDVPRRTPTPKELRIVFDGPPGPLGGRFVEVEDETGTGVRVGTWVEREDGYHELRLLVADPQRAQAGPVRTATPDIPLGTPVVYYPTKDRAGRLSSEGALTTRTRSAAWRLGDGRWVVAVEGKAGGVALDHLELLDVPCVHGGLDSEMTP